MIKNILNNQFKSITAAAIVLGAASLASCLLGFIRDRILYGLFGAGSELDIYRAAFRVPDFVYYLAVVGAISAGFIPVFVDYLKKDKTKAWALVNNLVNLLGLLLIVLGVALFIFAPSLVKLVVPGFSENQLIAVAKLTRIMALNPFLLGLGAIFGGVLQSLRRFFIYALAPIAYNLGIIFGALFLIKPFGLAGLAYGVVIGAFFHFLIQFFAAYHNGFTWQLTFDWQSNGIKRITKVMLPRILSLALNQVNVVAMTVIASFLAVGSISIYDLAYNIWSFPLGIFAISFVTASFPWLSEKAQKKDAVEFIKTFSATARQIIFFIVPSAALLVVLRAQVVRLMFGTGRFNWEDTILTLDTLAYFCLALFAEGLIWLFLRGFFAWEDAKTPFVLGIVATVIRLTAAWSLAIWLKMGVPGLALAFSIGSVFYLIFLFIFLSAKLRIVSPEGAIALKVSERKIITADSKVLVASFLAALAAYAALYLINPFVSTQTGIGLLIQGGLAGLMGVIVYCLSCWLLRVPELKIFLSALIRRWPWKKIPPEIAEVNGK